MTFLQYIKKHDRTLTLSTYLLPIILSVIVSLAHVVTFWDIANPMSWAIFLSIAVEVGVLSSIAASRISNWVWLPFTLVTFIQIVGNIFYSYVGTSVTDPLFKSWVELSDPFFNFIGFGTDGDPIVHKRIVAMFLGSFVPLMSIMFFQFFIKSIRTAPTVTDVIDSPVVPVEPPVGTFNRVTGEVDLSHNKIPMQKDYHFPSPDHTQPMTIETLPEPPMNGLRPNDPYGAMVTLPMEPAMRMDHFSPVRVLPHSLPEPEAVTKDELPEIAADYEPSEAQQAIDNMHKVPRELLQQPYGKISSEPYEVEDPDQLKLFNPDSPPVVEEPAVAQDRIIVFEDEKKK